MLDQIIQAHSIVDIAFLSEDQLFQAIGERFRAKLRAAGELPDMRAKDGEILFRPQWDRRELFMELRWKVGEAEPLIHPPLPLNSRAVATLCDSWPAVCPGHPQAMWAALIGKGYLTPDKTIGQAWLDAARDLSDQLQL